MARFWVAVLISIVNVESVLSCYEDLPKQLGTEEQKKKKKKSREPGCVACAGAADAKRLIDCLCLCLCLFWMSLLAS